MTRFAIALALVGSLATSGCSSTIMPADGDAALTDIGFDATASDALDVPADIAADVPRDREMCPVGDSALCEVNQVCLECSAGPMSFGGCVTPCTTSAECTDPANPFCVRGGCNDVQYCAPQNTGCACAICAAEHTPIATPRGERAIEVVKAGDIVFGERGERFVPVRVVRVSRTRVWHHTMVRVTLRGGRVVEMSARHPTVDGRRFGELAAGDALGGAEIEQVETVPYAGEYTYDVLTDGDQGAYVAAGVLVGSTLWGRGEGP